MQGEHGEDSSSTLVYMLDVASRELRAVLTVPATAHNAAYTADGGTVVLGMMEHGMIAGYNGATFEESFTASGFQMPLEVTPTLGGVVLVAESGASRVAVFDPVSQSVSAHFEVGAVPVAAWATGGVNYFVSAEEGMQLRHLVEAGRTITMDDHMVDVGGSPGQALLTPNGRELWVAVENRGVIAVLDADSHLPITEIAAGEKPHGIAFDPSGSRAFVTDEDGGKLVVMDVTSHPRPRGREPPLLRPTRCPSRPSG